MADLRRIAHNLLAGKAAEVFALDLSAVSSETPLSQEHQPPAHVAQALAMAKNLMNGDAPAIGSFVAGTLVHTAEGLVPIENIRVGMQVLSQPEDGGERALRRVVNKMSTLDQPLMAVQIHIEGHKGSELTTIFATPNHPFWIDVPLADGKHWLAAECLEPCMTLQLADGRSAEVRSAAVIRRTQYEDIFFAGDERLDLAQVLCLKDGKLEVVKSEHLTRLGKLDLGDRYLTPVYNFEVERFHTYYVGQAGVWVHNATCFEDPTPGAAVDFAMRKAERDAPRPTCFPVDTYVVAESMQWVEIDRLSVGSKVLSRCEKTGKQEFKRITRKFEHTLESLDEMTLPSYVVTYVTPTGNESAVEATGEHPFWVIGEGWVNAEDLKPGQLLEVCDPVGEVDSNRPDGQKMRDYAFSGNRWQARISAVSHGPGMRIAYNIEVEDFHTYFVGCHGIWVHNKNQGEPVFRQALKESNPDARANAGRNDENRRPEATNDIANSNANRGENEPADTLAKYDNLEVVQLPQSTTLGKTTGHPDLLINGRTADVFTPQRPVGDSGPLLDPQVKASKIDRIHDVINDKSIRQSSDIVLNLNQLEGTITGADILTRIAERPIPSLGRLYIIEPGKVPVVVDFPSIPNVNHPIYGQLSIRGNSTEKMASQPSTGVKRLTAAGVGESESSMPLTVASIQSVLPTVHEYWLAAGASAMVLDRIQVGIGDLSQAVAAQTFGTQVTLSVDGAGWGWFVDTTPAMQEEFGSGLAPEVFQALDGSTAEGKLDLLTVLIHEIGHALGLEHADETHDVMAAVLTPGERRLLDDHVAADLRAAGQYVAPDRSSITRITSPGRTGDLASTPQFAAIANPRLINGDFGPEATTGWVAEGGVQVDGSSAVLHESPTRQTHLAQGFMVNPGDRLLSFTLAGEALRGNGAGPSDAFEVALLNANTGAALGSTVALSRSDALLNWQAGAQGGVTERLAQGVRKVANADGSATYFIDLAEALAGNPAGLPAYLSFDLLGFGAADSHVTLRDVRLISDPVAFADASTLADAGDGEGNALGVERRLQRFSDSRCPKPCRPAPMRSSTARHMS